MNRERIAYLIDRLLHQDSTEEEKEELAEWINNAKDNVELTDLLEEAWKRYEPVPEARKAMEPALDNILEGLLREINEARNPVIPIQDIRPPLFRLSTVLGVAAALILLLVFAAVVYRFNRRMPVPPSAPPMSLHIPPGNNKATLTLSDNSIIPLDSATTGPLATQGAAVVVQGSAGQLAYKASLGTTEKELAYNVLATPRGGQFRLILPDGSKAWLNAASSIRYPVAFTGKDRTVSITGEVYFEVVHRDETPFQVKVGRDTIQDLGTHFDINAYEDESSVSATLLEGSVRITGGVVLTPGQQARIDGDVLSGGAGNIRVVDNVDVEQVVAWKNGYFQFDHSDLRVVMRQLSRWYDVDIRFEKGVPDRQFGGKIPRTSNLADVCQVLQLENVHFKMEDRTIIVTP